MTRVALGTKLTLNGLEGRVIACQERDGTFHVTLLTKSGQMEMRQLTPEELSKALGSPAAGPPNAQNGPPTSQVPLPRSVEKYPPHRPVSETSPPAPPPPPEEAPPSQPHSEVKSLGEARQTTAESAFETAPPNHAGDDVVPAPQPRTHEVFDADREAENLSATVVQSGPPTPAESGIAPTAEGEPPIEGAITGSSHLDAVAESAAAESTSGAPAVVIVPSRPYQKQAVEAWCKNGHVGVLNMATGTGKTLTSLLAFEACWPISKLAVVACPTRVLVEQWTREIKKAIPTASVFRVGEGDAWRWATPRDDVPTFLVGTLHTLSKPWFKAWFIREIGPAEAILIVDEVHRAGSRVFAQIFDLPAARRLGLSATPRRDWDPRGNQRLRRALQREVFRMTLAEAIAGGYLVRYTYHVHPLPLVPEEREAYNEISGRISRLLQALGFNAESDSLPSFLQALEDTKPEEAEAVRELLITRSNLLKEALGKESAVERLLVRHDLERCLIYLNNVPQVHHYRRLLQKAGRTAAIYTSEQDDVQRKQALQAFERGHVEFLLSIRCLDEGVDIPDARSAILISSSTTTREFVQRRGRLLRRAPEKTEAAIHDLLVLPVDPESFHGELTPHEVMAIQKEIRRALIFNEDALNAAENERMIAKILAGLGVEAPPDYGRGSFDEEEERPTSDVTEEWSSP